MRLREIRALYRSTHVMVGSASKMLGAIGDLLNEVERLRETERARRAEDDTKEVPV